MTRGTRRAPPRRPEHVCQFLIVLPGEDVGGTRGYAEFLHIIRDRRHPEHAETLTWVGGAFDPHAFDPATVAFDDPRQRWRMAFEGP